MNEVDGTSLPRDIEGIFDREDLERVSHNARELVETEYSFEGAVDRWQGMLRAATRANSP